jgi:hypothetical protein
MELRSAVSVKFDHSVGTVPDPGADRRVWYTMFDEKGSSGVAECVQTALLDLQLIRVDPKQRRFEAGESAHSGPTQS